MSTDVPVQHGQCHPTGKTFRDDCVHTMANTARTKAAQDGYLRKTGSGRRRGWCSSHGPADGRAAQEAATRRMGDAMPPGTAWSRHLFGWPRASLPLSLPPPPSLTRDERRRRSTEQEPTSAHSRTRPTQPFLGLHACMHAASYLHPYLELASNFPVTHHNTAPRPPRRVLCITNACLLSSSPIPLRTRPPPCCRDTRQAEYPR